MATNKDYTTLLKIVSDISQKYEKKYTEKQKAGEYYNIFNIIGKASDEVNIHTKFLTNLLDPKGDHGCGDIFLKLFLEQVKVNIGKNINLENSRVYYEYDIGPITENSKNGGRLDILIEINNNFAIIIENKIYAGDQPKQLLRYKNYAAKYRKYKIFYLTPNGYEPSDESTGNNDKYWEEISYEEHIKSFLENWLKDNKKQTHIYPIIQQYIQLIDCLTDNCVSEDEEKDIRNLLLANNNIELAIDLCEKILPAKKEIFKKLFNTLKNEVKNINNKIIVNLEINDSDSENEEQVRYWRIYIHKNCWNSRLTFEIDSKTFECKFGITLKKEENTTRLQKKLRALKPNKNNHEWWMIWEHPSENYAYWDAEIFANINKNPKTFVKILTDKIESYINVLDGIEEKKFEDGILNSDSDQEIDENNILLKKNYLLYAEKLCNQLDEALVLYFEVNNMDVIENWGYDKYFDDDKKYLYFIPLRNQNSIIEIGFGNYLEDGFIDEDIQKFNSWFDRVSFDEDKIRQYSTFNNNSWVGRKYKYNGDYSQDSLQRLRNDILMFLETLLNNLK